MKEKLWTTTFVVNMLLNFIFYLVFYLPTVVIGTMAMDHYHASASIAGILSGIFIVGGFIARLWAGNNMKRLGAKKLLYIGTLIYFLLTFVYFIVHSVALLLILRLVHGVGFGIAATASGTLAGAIVPSSRRGEGIGYYALSVTLSSAVGPFLSMFLYRTSGFYSLIWLSALLLFLALIGIFFLRVNEKPTDSSAITENHKKFAWSNYFEKEALPISLIAFLIGISYSSILSFMDAYALNIHLSEAASFFFLVYAITVLLSRPITGRIFDGFGDNFVMYPTYLFFALGLLLIGLAQSGWMLLIAAIFIGLGYGSFSPFGQAIAIRNSEAHRLGVTTSTFFGFMDMGVGFGPFILGMFMPLLGYRNLYFASAILALLIAVIYHFVHGRHVKTEN
ncbi:MFS transporter [Lactococcus cremoris]|jgi:MFS family permease|uniref:Permease of the major facilitator superfamily n=2 Tax=Lactococcus lactis subsp. cremoris TaxID=1359 RepID=A0A084AAB3_LACLC|nr:MFS transporter [Lactococcus cremoris]TRW56623.1 MFS transporter [Lactococcus lactis]KEY62242.1 Permease of the major facilitator superfamily [Lactococcus cremoris subsp. cremoris GE214]KKW71589.1 multidrug resistance protein [Lactococcus cremoris]KZK41542.1 Zinc transport protein ZntB [Lactococcus cremoris]MCT0502336.1 MFS transporter [Lactococcus cremoris]